MMKNILVSAGVLLALVTLAKTTILFNNGNGISPYTGYPDLGGSQFFDSIRKRCPVCDSSVYSYCSDKLFHDSCCCHNPNNPYDRLPYECQYADCSFLHSNTCYEHKLISACCCTNYIARK